MKQVAHIRQISHALRKRFGDRRKIENGAAGSRATWTGKPARIDEPGGASINYGVGAGLDTAGVVAADAPLASTFIALITYVTVTVEPTFTSPLAFIVGSRSISHRSVPFCTVILLPVISSTVPVTWYVFAPAANVVPLNAKLNAASKQIVFRFINRDKPVHATTQVFQQDVDLAKRGGINRRLL